MNNLIEIQVNENQEQTISGRELHMFLGKKLRTRNGLTECVNMALRKNTII